MTTEHAIILMLGSLIISFLITSVILIISGIKDTFKANRPIKKEHEPSCAARGLITSLTLEANKWNVERHKEGIGVMADYMGSVPITIEVNNYRSLGYRVLVIGMDMSLGDIGWIEDQIQEKDIFGLESEYKLKELRAFEAHMLFRKKSEEAENHFCKIAK